MWAKKIKRKDKLLHLTDKETAYKLVVIKLYDTHTSICKTTSQASTKADFKFSIYFFATM